MFCQKSKNLKFAERQINVFSGNRYQMPLPVNTQSGNLKHRRSFLLLRNTKLCTDPRRQDFSAERFGHVVVCAHFQTDHDIRFIAFGGQHDDGNLLCIR